jgi:transcription elongation factor GreA
MAKYKISEEKLAQLEADLEAAVEARKDIVEKVHVARELGDLKENSEYHAARDEQRLNELKIEDIEEILRDYEIADKGGTNSTIDIGNNVKLKGPKVVSSSWSIVSRQTQQKERFRMNLRLVIL